MIHHHKWLSETITRIFEKRTSDQQTTDGKAEWLAGIQTEVEEAIGWQVQELEERKGRADKEMRGTDWIRITEILTGA